MNRQTAILLQKFWKKVEKDETFEKLFSLFLENPTSVLFSLGPFGKLIAGAELDWVSEDIFAHDFHIDSEFDPSEELQAVQFDKGMSISEIRAELGKMGLVPARIENLLVYAKNNPNEQKKHAILVIDSRINKCGDDYVYFPFLGGSEAFGDTKASRLLGVFKVYKPYSGGTIHYSKRILARKARHSFC